MPGQPDTDHQLLKEAQQGEAEAFGVLYERHATAIYRYLLAHLGSRPDAEDLTSEVFLRVWQFLPKYHQRGVPFRAFLFRIAHNALVDHYRQRRNKVELFNGVDGSLVDDQDGPVESLVDKTNRLELSRILAGLRDDHRMVLVLRFISQLSPVETAVAMQRSVGAVRVLQHRAIAELRKRINEKKAE